VIWAILLTHRVVKNRSELGIKRRLIVQRKSQKPERSDLRYESLPAAAVDQAGSPRDGKVSGQGVASDVGVAGPVHGDAQAVVVARPADVPGVDETRAVGLHLGHEGVNAAVVGQAGSPRSGEVGRAGFA